MSVSTEDIFDRISNHHGVMGVIALTNKGIAINSTFDDDQTTVWVALVCDCIAKARVVGRILEDGSNVTMLRIRSSRYEVMIAPEKDYILVAIHEQSEGSSEKKEEEEVHEN